MNKYIVTGRVRADIELNETVEAKSEKSAIKIAEKKLYLRCKINKFDVLDDEICCEKIEDSEHD